ncbi:MAG: DUF6528 family protein, partial [Planctomycetia bacterium]|nr:DUF6528 family protein [Planctomycetia bacterium]
MRTKAEMFNGRMTEWYTHDTKPEWECVHPEQKDVFIVVHPKDGEVKGRPLYVVFHSAGHSAQTALECTVTPGNHDIYHVPDDFYGLFVDCYGNRETDWWWGGLRGDEEITDDNRTRSGGGLQPVEKRIEDTISYTILRYHIDPDRIYGCGNSMGGSGVLGFGLRHGNIFAAIKANVPAGVNHAMNRLYLPVEISTDPEDYATPEGITLPDPPICLDYSAPDDRWSGGHELLFAGMKARRYPLIAYWGNFGHQNNHGIIKKVNDLIDTFPWTEIRRNEAYPVFTNASSDSEIPWPDQKTAKSPGQVNAFFRWKNITDTEKLFQISVSLMDDQETSSVIFEIPEKITTDISIRRLQRFIIQPCEMIRWKFASETGTVRADATGLITIPTVTVSTAPRTLELTRVTDSSVPDDLVAQLRRRISDGPDGPATFPVVVTEQNTGRILILRSGVDWNQPDAIEWEWNPAESPEIASEHVAWFSHGSDAKPVRGTDQLLTVASGGGVALIRLVDRKVLFHAFAGGNPHSAAILP